MTDRSVILCAEAAGARNILASGLNRPDQATEFQTYITHPKLVENGFALGRFALCVHDGATM